MTKRFIKALGRRTIKPKRNRSMHMLNSMTIVAKRDDVLLTLRNNRESHAAIVREAREGYVAKAKAALSARLDKLASGKIVSLSFSLQAPIDYTRVYDTAIRMLELHQNETVVLDANQVRNLDKIADDE